MAEYVGLTIRIHGLGGPEGEGGPTPEEVRQIVDRLLREHFKPSYDSDVEVEIQEWAGEIPAADRTGLPGYEGSEAQKFAQRVAAVAKAEMKSVCSLENPCEELNETHVEMWGACFVKGPIDD